jgi:hypothetical protein
MDLDHQLKRVTLAGPDVKVSLTGGGKAQVSIFLSIDDNDFAFVGGATDPPSVQLDPGTYDCAATILAFDHNAVGLDYTAQVNVGGHIVASTQGVLPDSKTDGKVFGFTLIVQ